eukprot:gnl/TRDRNA2_/TRDRNA2_51923_c0_seq1.p1 gnl/TRDRNA2_/TRDRNA2_51923_c0~~gnl/TRDRNA2_/TRDRNA2_51923_c0_seq1.p1  ORF type:complete len:491 (+),score=62.07 gnl/TRDRNA2_/TRDRNA2_51923_c0_seq1:48-1475(+)
MGPYVTLSRHLEAGASSRWAALMTAQVIAASTGNPAGPGHLNVAFRKPLFEVGDEHAEKLSQLPHITRGTLVPTPSQVDDLVRLVDSADGRGIVVCGPLAPATVDTAAFARAVHELARKLGWPLIAEPASGLRFGPHRHDGLVDNADVLMRHEATRRHLSPRAVIQFGQHPTSGSVGQWLGNLPGAHRHVLIDADGRWCDPELSADVLLVADPVVTANQLVRDLEARRPRHDEAWMKAWSMRSKAAADVLKRHASHGWWEGRVALEVVQRLGGGDQLWTASSMPIRDVDQFGGQSDQDISMRASRGCNGIDGTIASATGAALAWTEGRTEALLGDLAFMHDLSGLHTASTLNASVGLIVVDNGGGGIFSFLPIAALDQGRFERLFLTPQLTDIGAICKALGAKLHTVADEGELAQALDAHFATEGLAVLHLVIDRDENIRRHRSAYADVADALDRVEASSGDASFATDQTVRSAS